MSVYEKNGTVKAGRVEQAPSGAGAAKDPRLRRVAMASMVGTLIEGYDFGLYTVAAALVFPKVFFPGLTGAAGTVASLATVAVAFVIRPLGAVVLGHFGDRLGRKRMLVATILGMGAGTTLMGVVPSAAAIGVAAPILIILLRALQGLALGGEFAAAVLFATEHAPARRRGLYVMFPQLGHALPVSLSAVTFLVVGLTIDPATFISWGWRIPFLASALLVIVGLVVRLKAEETPVFSHEVETRGASHSPLRDALKAQPSRIIRGAGVAVTTLMFVYVSGAFIANYGFGQLGMSRNQVFAANAVAGLVFTAATVLSAYVSDRVSRRKLIGFTQAGAAVWALALFPILNLTSLGTYFGALCVTMMFAGLAYGPAGAYLAEQFDTRYRASALGLSYQITGVVAGGLAPLLAPLVVANAGTTAWGVVMAVLCALGAAGTLSLKDHNEELTDARA
ncbi:MFS transporter [Nocardia sp. CA2R105]|uniref:MFS transporter n=1 Tax=Nocardia coffeae TaxID=2873381 RepID=UPI001CA5F765|nr:MFS transporter [Nocardia coffeae]MBY8858684.1 MFS transporter [Nocardia coffeae]